MIKKIVKANGVQNALVKKDIYHAMYKQSFDKCKQFRHKQIAIRSHDHQMVVYEKNKITLSPFDTKKWIADNGITTRGYRHYLIKHEMDAAINAFIEELLGN